MTKFKRLKSEARETATLRGHDLYPFKTALALAKGWIAIAHCKKCDFIAVVNTHPAPNGVEISGGCVAVTCPNKKEQL